MTDTTEPYGRLHEADGGWRLEFSRRLAHPPTKVWRALTEPAHLDAWFPTTIEGLRTPGAKLHFAFGDEDLSPFDGEMINFDPPRLLEFSWGVGETLRFELRSDGAGTLLTFVHKFSRLAKATHDAAGWHECFELLAYDLDGQRSPFQNGSRWVKVLPWYREQFGPEASRLGPPEHHW